MSRAAPICSLKIALIWNQNKFSWEVKTLLWQGWVTNKTFYWSISVQYLYNESQLFFYLMLFLRICILIYSFHLFWRELWLEENFAYKRKNPCFSLLRGIFRVLLNGHFLFTRERKIGQYLLRRENLPILLLKSCLRYESGNYQPILPNFITIFMKIFAYKRKCKIFSLV